MRRAWLVIGVAVLFQLILVFSDGLYFKLAIPEYLFIHSLLETVSIVVSSAVFLVSWTALRGGRFTNFVLLGCAFIGVAILDFAHTMSVTGMPAFLSPSGAGKGINLWISARMLAAVAVLAVAFRPWTQKEDSRSAPMWLVGVLLFSVLVSGLGLASPESFPAMWLPGAGLTPLKVGLEYLLILMHGMTAWVLWRKCRSPQPFNVVSLFLATVLMGLSEVFFTLYANVTDAFNLAGHLYKVLGYGALFHAIFVDSIARPFKALEASSQALRESQRALLDQKDQLHTSIEMAMDAVISVDADFKVLLFNRAAEKMFDYPASEVIGQALDILIPGRFRQRHNGHIANFGASGDTGRRMGALSVVYALRRDGTEVPVEASISRSVNEGRPVYSVILRDISVRLGQEKALRDLAASLEQKVEARTRELKEANHELEAFSYSVSHDLRAPLRHMQAYGEMLRATATGLDAESQGYLDRILQATGNMQELISELLSLARVGRTPMNLQPVELELVLSETLETLGAATADSPVLWTREILPVVEGDPILIQTVFLNLLSNALKYSSRATPPKIHVGVMPQTNPPVLFVRDNGVGFDMKHASKLFNAFERLHSQTDFPGIGIGLATVRRIVARHGGRIWVEAALQQGATFYFTLSPEVCDPA